MEILLDKKIKYDNCIELTPRMGLKRGEIIPITSNTMLKAMLGNESKKKFIAYFLSLVLDEDMSIIEKNIEHQKNAINKDNYVNRRGNVELVVNLNDKVYNIEITNNSTKEEIEQNIDYAFKLYGEKGIKGDRYEYEYIVQINLNNFYFGGVDRIKDIFILGTGNGKNAIKNDKITFIDFYLSKIVERYCNKEEISELEKLLLVLNSKKLGEYSEFIEENNILEEIQKEAYNVSMDNDIKTSYEKDVEDDILKDMIWSNAYDEGMEDAKIDIGKKLTEIGSELMSKPHGIDITELLKKKV